MNIRPAITRDIDDICRLLALLFAQEAEFTPDRETQQRGVEAILANPDQGLIFVLEQSGRIAAIASLQFLISTALGGKVALLEDVIVEEAFRGKGLGAALIQHIRQYAAGNNILRLTLLTDAHNAPAQAFYKKQGFQTSPMIPMRLYPSEQRQPTVELRMKGKTDA